MNCKDKDKTYIYGEESFVGVNGYRVTGSPDCDGLQLSMGSTNRTDIKILMTVEEWDEWVERVDAMLVREGCRE